eukprot:m.190762 g.190762  ORF g.190762 m.190762 type:complete len:108 (-) comp18571_c0_seq3:1082-1405(-)
MRSDTPSLRDEAELSCKDVSVGIQRGAVINTDVRRGAETVHISIVTLEQTALRILLTTSGYKLDSEEDMWHETLHQLLMESSPGYKRKFTDSLTEKLLDLQRERGED